MCRCAKERDIENFPLDLATWRRFTPDHDKSYLGKVIGVKS